MRSMRSTPTGGRPLPAFGYTGSIRAHSSRHGTTRSISARNCARRVVFAYFSKPVPASVICLRAIITSRGRPLPVSSQHVGLKRERVIQRFPRALSFNFGLFPKRGGGVRNVERGSASRRGGDGAERDDHLGRDPRLLRGGGRPYRAGVVLLIR